MSLGDDVLRPLVQDMSNGLASFFGLNLTDVLKSPEDYSPAGAKLMTAVSSTVVQPVAAVVLAVLFMVELNRVLLVTDGDGDTRLRMSYFTLAKFGVIKVFFDLTPIVMKAIYGVLSDAASQANALLAPPPGGSTPSVDAFIAAAEKMDWLGKTVLVVVLFFAWLIHKGAVLIALGLVVMRFIKIYIYGSFAPMPLAFLATPETRTWGLNFLRTYGATVLQGFVLVMAFGVYQQVSNGWATTALSNLDGNSFVAALSIGSFYMFMGVALGMTVAGSGKIASELLGA